MLTLQQSVPVKRMPSPSPSNGSTASSTSLVSEGRKSTTSAGQQQSGGKKFGKLPLISFDIQLTKMNPDNRGSTLKPGMNPSEAMGTLKRHHSMSCIYKRSASAANFVLENHGVSAPKHQEMPKLPAFNSQFYSDC